jgi:hypothetical protein
MLAPVGGNVAPKISSERIRLASIVAKGKQGAFSAIMVVTLAHRANGAGER